jgi:hypothetical protein
MCIRKIWGLLHDQEHAQWQAGFDISSVEPCASVAVLLLVM